MSKKIKTKDYEIKVTPTTKDETYVLDKKIATANDTYIQIHPEDISPISMSIDFAVKEGSKDLVLIGLGYNTDTSTYTKATTQTIKNYLTYAPDNNNLVSYCSYSDVQKVINKKIYLATGTVKEELNSQYGGKGSNTYKAIKKYSDGIDHPSDFFELGGNDKYDLLTNMAVQDMSGNDKYTLASEQIYIYEHAGKDSYTFNNGRTDVKDEKGNDKYTVNKNAIAGIYDYEGKDKYSAKDTEDNEDAYLTITDYSGKDSYSFNHATYIRITDGVAPNTYYSELKPYINKGGNDSYSFVYSTDFEVVDFSGDDNYKITKCSNKDASLPIIDYYGKDTYTITDSEYTSISDESGNDKYTVSGSETLNITLEDEYGDDTYNVTKNAKQVTVTDDSGDDTYKITNGANFTNITDKQGGDTYKLNGTKKNKVENIFVTDNSGDDKYNLSYCDGAQLTDNSGNDTYTVAKTSNVVLIEDNGGNDTLVLSGAKSKDIIYMSYNNKGNDEMAKAEAGALFLYNKKLDTFVRIDKFYTISGNTYSGPGNGNIETIKAGSSKITAPTADYFTETINSEVAYWLGQNGYETLSEALYEGAGENLIQFFQAGNA